MLLPDEFGEIVSEFALGEDPVLEGVASRGELGQVWRLETSTGTWAVKELFYREEEADTRLSAEFQEVAVRAGVPAPAVVRTADRRVLLDLDGRQFRVFSWVDILPPDPDLDPRMVGVLVAGIHRLGHPSMGPNSEERRHAEAAINEHLCRPLTRQVIDQILDSGLTHGHHR